jgi:hypothetical protein
MGHIKRVAQNWATDEISQNWAPHEISQKWATDEISQKRTTAYNVPEVSHSRKIAPGASFSIN